MEDFLKGRLFKTREGIFGRIKNLITGSRQTDEIKGELEEILISSDISVKTTKEILDKAFAGIKSREKEEFIEAIKREILNIFSRVGDPVLRNGDLKPLTVMVVGVNGVGKTTTIGKMAKTWIRDGKKVLLGACDTFRAAAIEQLEVWGDKVNSKVIKQKVGGDPASVAFDAFKAAKAQGCDFLILDTAGRLHTKHNLMEELKKIKRVLGKDNNAYPQEILLILDATFGQNSLAQVKEFNDSLLLTGLVVTKMDGTAKGGAIITIANEYSIPIKYIGMGEGEEDLIPFDPKDFVDAIFS